MTIVTQKKLVLQLVACRTFAMQTLWYTRVYLTYTLCVCVSWIKRFYYFIKMFCRFIENGSSSNKKLRCRSTNRIKLNWKKKQPLINTPDVNFIVITIGISIFDRIQNVIFKRMERNTEMILCAHDAFAIKLSNGNNNKT